MLDDESASRRSENTADLYRVTPMLTSEGTNPNYDAEFVPLTECISVRSCQVRFSSGRISRPQNTIDEKR